MVRRGRYDVDPPSTAARALSTADTVIPSAP
jgi:hypothetical protein